MNLQEYLDNMEARRQEDGYYELRSIIIDEINEQSNHIDYDFADVLRASYEV